MRSFTEFQVIALLKMETLSRLIAARSLMAGMEMPPSHTVLEPLTQKIRR